MFVLVYFLIHVKSTGNYYIKLSSDGRSDTGSSSRRLIYKSFFFFLSLLVDWLMMAVSFLCDMLNITPIYYGLQRWTPNMYCQTMYCQAMYSIYTLEIYTLNIYSLNMYTNMYSPYLQNSAYPLQCLLLLLLTSPSSQTQHHRAHYPHAHRYSPG